MLHRTLLYLEGAINPITATYNAAHVVGFLGDLIADDGLGPGERRPPIRELALRLGGNAGTVRDALLDSQGKGLVRVLPCVRAVVSSVDEAKVSPSIAADLGHHFRDIVEPQDQNLPLVLETRKTLELTRVVRAAQQRELPELFQLRRILEEMVAVPWTVESLNHTKLNVPFHLENGRLSGNTVMTSLLEIFLQ